MIIPNALLPNMLKVQRMPIGQVWPIFKRMLGLLKKHSILWTPMVRMVLFDIIIFALPIIGMLYVNMTNNQYLHDNSLKFSLILIGIGILLYLLRSFYFGYLFGILSALIYLDLRGKEMSLKNAKYIIRKRALSLGILHILSSVVSGFLKRRQQKNTAPSLIPKALFNFASMEAIDIFGHFLVPVIVIENENLTDSLKHLQKIPQHLSATLSGAIGVSMTKTILSLLLIPFGAIVIAGCFFIGKYGINFFPQSTIFTLGTQSCSLVPMALGGVFLFFLTILLGACMEGLKIIYFTLLYALMAHPEKIQPEKRALFTGLANKP